MTYRAVNKNFMQVTSLNHIVEFLKAFTCSNILLVQAATEFVHLQNAQISSAAFKLHNTFLLGMKELVSLSISSMPGVDRVPVRFFDNKQKWVQNLFKPKWYRVLLQAFQIRLCVFVFYLQALT